MNHLTRPPTPPLLALLVLSLAGLACALTQPTAAHMSAPLATFTAPAKLPTARSTATYSPALQECTVNTAFLHLRQNAGIESPVIGYLAEGDLLTLAALPPVGDWQNVITPTGKTGWVHTHFIHCIERINQP